MSTEDKDIATHESTKDVAESPQMPEVIIDRSKDEVTIVDPKGQSLTFKTKVIESEEPDEEDSEPMTPEEFRDALERLDKLGLTWTADVSPQIKAKTPEAEAALVCEEFSDVQNEYPGLPFEIYLACSYALTKDRIFAMASGNQESLKEKANIASEVVIDAAFRHEFFFKHAIKVPYLSDIDWEVVFKLYEKGAEGIAGIPYGLLALSLQDPFNTNRVPNQRHITVAVDETLVNKLLESLNKVKLKLENARRISDVLNEQHLLEGKDNDDEKAGPQLGQ